MRKSQQVLLLDKDAHRHSEAAGGGGGSESYSSNSSFTDTYSDSSDLANWEEFVAEDGSLFYAEYMPHAQTATNETGAAPDRQRVEFTRNSSLRLGKKARRQQPQKQKAQLKPQQTQDQKFLFCHIKSQVPCKHLELVITAGDRYRFGRRSTAVESILGFRVVAFPDQPECLMVEDLVHDMPTMQQPQEAIKRGDWFKSLDDIEVRASNVDELLLQFTQPTKVMLKFQGPEKPVESEGDATGAIAGTTPTKVTDFACFSTMFEHLQLGSTKADSTDLKLPFAMMIIPPECYQQDEHKDSMFYYPEDTQLNFLYKARGSFLTLNAVLTEELNTPPLLSKLMVENVQYFVTYRTFNGFLVLFAFNEQCQTEKETSLRTDELMLYLRFAFPTLHVEHFGHNNTNATRLRTFLHNLAHVQHVRVTLLHRQQQILFEELLPESRCMPLPKEAQLRIFDALSEMEAMDYRNWNDEPLNTHREFFIHGSVLYYEHFMLASQLPIEARAQVECFMRCRGIFDFISGHNVKELYVWQEIVLPNASGRYFLTICTRSHLILAVILKLFDAPDMPTAEERVPPSLFYIEEIQETLDHLIQCGIESLAMFWAVSNKRPEVLEKLDPHDAGDVNSNPERHARKFETLLKHKLTSTSSAASTSNTQAAARSSSCDEEAHLCSSLGGSSIHSLTPSDDGSNKRRGNANAEESDSDGGSDWEGFTTQNPLHYGDAECQAEMTESLWREINNVLPVNISPGWKNSIYYYIYLDSANGTIFCPLKVNNAQFPFIRELRKAFHTIHDVLQSTKRFRQKLAQEPAASTSSGNSSCGGSACEGKVAVKEHGMTIVVRETNKSEAAGGESQGAIKGRFSVVGRLFSAPDREVYICHRPDVAQNMVEMAFRLSFFTVG